MAEYVNNKELYNAYVDWHEKRKQAEEQDKPVPQPPKIIQQAILDIPRRLATKGNFSGYSFKEDMIGDAIIDMTKYFDRFDPEKSKYPFAYLTQISFHAFIRRITTESKQTYIKQKLIKNSDLRNIVAQLPSDDNDYKLEFLEVIKENMDDTLEEKFGKKKKPKKKPKKETPSIEDLM